MRWMRYWSTPHPLFVRTVRGVEVDGAALAAPEMQLSVRTK